MGHGETMMIRRAIGIGASSAAKLEDVLALIQATAGLAGFGACLATLDRRQDLARQVADLLDLELRLFTAEQLAAVPDTVTLSSRSADAVGSPSVAEAAALAALGPGGWLAIPRKTGILCTCALAELP
jgi:cobalt-precorrin 5A hydrolase